MKKMSLLAAIMLFTTSWFACTAQEAKADDVTKVAASETVEVYYFHNTRRCATCEAVESVTKSTLEETYPEQMKNGTMTFLSLNVEDETNEPLARELHVSGQTLLIVKDGKKKDLTNDAFMYARSKPDKLKEKIVNTIAKL
jgi:PBP1b-binding outer membrane lipoprotein LpoB